MMNPKYLVDKVHESYTDNVIPLINEGDYVKASITVNNLVSHVNQKQEHSEIMAFVKMGGTYIVALEILLDKLRKGNKVNIERAMKDLEIYYAQTKETGDINFN